MGLWRVCCGRVVSLMMFVGRENGVWSCKAGSYSDSFLYLILHHDGKNDPKKLDAYLQSMLLAASAAAVDSFRPEPCLPYACECEWSFRHVFNLNDRHSYDSQLS